MNATEWAERLEAAHGEMLTLDECEQLAALLRAMVAALEAAPAPGLTLLNGESLYQSWYRTTRAEALRRE